MRRLPLSCLLFETDSPVLSATAGERNEPANVRVALQAVAELKDVAETEIAERVHENTVRLFGESLGSGEAVDEVRDA